MPGNEAADRLYNFFEQENLAQGQRSSQAAGPNWPLINNNLWAGNQRQIGAARNSDTKEYTIQQSDSEGGSNVQSSQGAFHPDNAHLTQRPEFAKSQFQNQEGSLNGFIRGHQGLQNRQNHLEFLRAKEVSDQLKLTSRGLSIIEQQRGNAPEHSPVLARISERLETPEGPTNFHHLERELLTSNQQTGVSQPQPRQQPGFKEMQMWQQQLMFKQLQELQRQKQFQQLEHEGRHPNQMNQLSAAFTKQVASDQLPVIVNGMPIHGSANYVWQNEVTGGDSKVPGSSQMFLVGNTNWAQRGGYSAVQGIPDGMLSNEQGQMLRSMGLVPQQLDQLVYGAHNATTRGAFNQYSHLQGISQDCTEPLNKESGNHLEKSRMQSLPLANSLQGQSTLFSNQVSMHDGASVSRQDSQERNSFVQIPFQGMSSGVQPANYMQVSSVSGNAQMQELQGREQHQAGWSGNLHESASSQIGSSQGMVTLDPTEKKILFSSDDIWDAPVGKGGAGYAGGYGNPLDRVENAFPSMQSGTWSALMQSAVAEASSSDTGLQEEWSGLSQPLALGGNAKKQTDWADSNMQSASVASRQFPSQSREDHNTPDFQQSGTRNLCEQSERMQQHEASYESIRQPLSDSGKWLERIPQQKTLIEGNHHFQPSLNSENAFQSSWARQIQSESVGHGTNVALDAHNMHGSWVHQHGVSSHNDQDGISSHNINNQRRNNPTAWNANISLSASGDAALTVSEDENRGQSFQRDDLKMGMHVERSHDGGLMMGNPFPSSTNRGGGHQVQREASIANNCTEIPNSNTSKGIQETNQHGRNNQYLNYRKHMADSPVNHRDDNMGYNQNPRGSQVLEASLYNSDRGSGEIYDKKRDTSYQKEFSNDSYNSYHSNQSQPTVTGGDVRENSWLSTSESQPMASANQKATGQVARKAPGQRRFQYHPMGSMEVDLEAADTSKRVAHMHAISQQVFQGSKDHEREYFGHPEFDTHTSNNSIAMEHMPEFQSTEKGSASSDGSGGTFSQSKGVAQTCQNMLELFHNADQSIEHGTPAHISSSDHKTSAVIPEAEGSDASFAHQWHNQSTASQGFGLRLAPPSQRAAVSNHALNTQNSSQIVSSLSSRQINPNVEDRSQTWLAPASSVHSVPHEIPQRESWDNNPNISRQTGNGTSQLNREASIPAVYTSSVPYSRSQLQPRQLSRMNEKVINQQSVNVSNNRHASSLRQMHGAYGKMVADQSVQVSLPGTTNRNTSVISPSEDTSQPERSSWSQVRVSGQQFPVLESVPVSRPSAVSGKSQPDDFSTMLHHVWANVSGQHNLTSAPTNISQFISPSNSNLERTSFAAQQLGHADTKRGGNVPEFARRSVNAQGLAYVEQQSGKESSWKQIAVEKVDQSSQEIGASQRQESLMKHPLDTKSIVSSSLVAHPHHKAIERGRYGKDPSLLSQRENLSVRNPATSTRDIEAFGRSLRQANQNYSLLHQVQSMKSTENDLDKRSGKRFKGADGDADAQQLANRSGQQLLETSNAIARDSSDNGPNAAPQNTSVSSGDGKMLNFSSEARENQSLNTGSQTVLGVVPSQEVNFRGSDSQGRSSQYNISSIRPENLQINPNMAPTWFDRYGTFRPEHIHPMKDAQSTVLLGPQQFHFGEGSEDLHTDTSKEQVNNVDACQIGNVCESGVTTIVHRDDPSQFQSLHSEVNDQTLAVVRLKKRKTETSMLMPWHKEIVHGFHRLQSISMAEKDWAHAANRLIKKMEDEAESADDGQTLILPRRRLIYTTQLMQQLFRPSPAKILSAKATSDYETVTFSVAKLALGEACSLISMQESVSSSPIVDVNEERESEKPKVTERVSDQYFSKVVENFIGRAQKLEGDLLRLDKRVSIMDLRVECQELERFSFINRFAKFHGRGQADAAETSSSSNAAAATTQKACPQRYVTANAMPRNLPGGVHCLSL